MEGKSKLTQEEKRLKRIAQLKAMLQQEEAKQNQEERKRRTGQLVAFGVYIEEFFKTSDDEAKKRLEERPGREPETPARDPYGGGRAAPSACKNPARRLKKRQAPVFGARPCRVRHLSRPA